MNSRRVFIALMLLILLSSTIFSHAEGMESSSPEKIMEAASKAIDEAELDPSIEKLERIQKEGMSDDSLSRLHFLLGKAKYIKIINDIRACRAEGTQKSNELQEYQVGPLIAALNHLNTSYELSPDSEWAPEALYAAGLIQGYGCLNRFEDAAESYRILAEKYPDTALGKAAEQKYESLKSSLSGKAHNKTHP